MSYLVDQLGNKLSKDTTANQLEVAIETALRVNHPLKSIGVFQATFIHKDYLKNEDSIDKTLLDAIAFSWSVQACSDYTHLFGTAGVKFQTPNKSLEVVVGTSSGSDEVYTAIAHSLQLSTLCHQ